MILVKPSFDILNIMGGGFDLYEKSETAMRLIEVAGRTCYESEKRITADSCRKFIKNILKQGHESVIEHSAMTVRFICDRGVTHELVRHRLCAFSQESTRYVNYKGGCTFVIPPWVKALEGKNDIYTVLNGASPEDTEWINSMLEAECHYIRLTTKGWSPQQARSVLPNSTKTEIVVTANFREWRHIFRLRCAKAAHPQMREIMIPLHRKCMELIPVLFDNITY